MLDVGWSELLVIGALALIVVGPRDLPQLLRTVGKFVGQIKRMAREFQRSMEDAARETDLGNMKELRDLRKDIGNLDFRQQAAKAQSYLKQPLKVEPAAGAKPAQPPAAAEAGTIAAPVAPAAATAGSDGTAGSQGAAGSAGAAAPAAAAPATAVPAGPDAPPGTAAPAAPAEHRSPGAKVGE